MKEQQDRARAAVVKGGSMGAQNETLSSIEVESTFLYETHTADGKLEVIVSEDKKKLKKSQMEQLNLSLIKLRFMPKWVDK